jgi:hypothetical protein
MEFIAEWAKILEIILVVIQALVTLLEKLVDKFD